MSGTLFAVWHDDEAREWRTSNGASAAIVLAVFLRVQPRRDWRYAVCLEGAQDVVLAPPNPRVVLLTAFDARSFGEISPADLDALQPHFARPQLYRWRSGELWALWDDTSRVSPTQSRGRVIVTPGGARCLLESPSVSALHGLRDADFAALVNPNRKGAVALITGERPTRGNVSHDEDVAIRRALCFVPLLVDCAAHDALSLTLPPDLHCAANHVALDRVRACVRHLRSRVDTAFASIGALSSAPFSAAVQLQYPDVAAFLFLLHRQGFSTLYALFDGWDYRSKIHLCVADYLRQWWIDE